MTARSHVRRLATARLISITGGAAAYLALMDHVFRAKHGSAAWLAATLVLTFGVAGIVSPLAGVLGDRFDRRRVMIASDLLGAACFLAMAAVHDAGLLLAFAFASAVVEVPFWSASAAAIPNLVGEEDLSWANGLVALGRNSGIVVGPVLGGVLVGPIGAQGVFVANAATFIFSALLIFSVRGRFIGDRSDASEHRGIRAGFRFVWRDRVLRTITLAWVTLVLGAGMGMVADRPLSAEFHAGSMGFGLIIAGWGTGSVLGSFAGRYMSERTEPPWLVGGMAIVCASGILVGVSAWWTPILVLTVVWGFGDGATSVAEQGIYQRRTPDAVRSRVMSASEAVVHSALAVSYLLASFMLDLVGPQGIYAVGGVAAGLATLVLVPTLRELRQAPTLEAEAEAG